MFNTTPEIWTPSASTLTTELRAMGMALSNRGVGVGVGGGSGVDVAVGDGMGVGVGVGTGIGVGVGTGTAVGVGDGVSVGVGVGVASDPQAARAIMDTDAATERKSFFELTMSPPDRLRIKALLQFYKEAVPFANALLKKSVPTNESNES